MPRSSTLRRRPTLPTLFIGSQAIEAGLITPSQLRSAQFQRVVHSVYAPRGMRMTHVLRAQAASLLAPPEAVLTGRSAATVSGVALAGPDDPVEFAVPERARFGPIRGLQVRRVAVASLAGKPWYGTRIAAGARIGFDLAARVDLATAVARLDAAVRGGVVDLVRLRTYLITCHDNDVRAVRAAVQLVDARAESQPESHCRVLLQGAGIPVVPQHVVRVGGRSVARVDLALPELKIAIEYDGRWHRDVMQFEADRRRLNALTAAGWTVVFVTAELLAQPERLVATVRAEIDRRTAR
jgi:very-short-patch-repair endonuclease